jgi:membrane fusion protein, copper/silver efflux system
MKKFLFAFLLVVLLVGAFLAGVSYKEGEGRKVDPNVAKPEAVNIEKAPDSGTDTSSLQPGTVRISHEKQQKIGVRIGTAEESAVEKTLRLLGRVAPDETRLFKVKAAVDGIILEVFPSTTGTMVKKGQRLASFYSPEIYAAEQGYLIALSSDRYKSNLQVQVNESRLKFLGMTASQVEELRKTTHIDETIIVQSPATGFVLSREVSPELRFLKGDELYRIAKLDRVWVFTDLYESEARYVQPHALAKVSHPQLGSFQAQVGDVLPLFDTTTRTLKVRLEVDNPEFLLRPDMFVDIELPVRLPPAIIVPADAVLDSGLKKTVFVDLGRGLFEPREVETGWRFDNRVEIKKGLKAGEKIAISGNFLIDSESRLEMAAAGMYGTLSKDPVCGVDVSVKKAEKAGRKSTDQQKIYYFCSEDCKRQFDKNPEKYVRQ